VSSPRLEYLTPRQVAGLLQVSEKTVHRWASSDPTMPAFRRGRVLRFERGRLEAWLGGQGAGAAQGSPGVRQAPVRKAPLS